MDLFRRLDTDDDFLDFFCDVLEEYIFCKRGERVQVEFRRIQTSIFFFIDNSSILQIMPDLELKYTYANSPHYEDEIKQVIGTAELQWKREFLIDQLIKKES